ncbi:Pre-mRNA-splicing factor cef1 [Maudiozyma exigua]|uniref:Pre-mRNA-splicing factor CEF1 n=1 Tax=Maudiozyma exigua TaxID=34358 RepID=A0A9P7BC10_MAUEX|nr:Pre-mRNA-splicing factor cef1 [Kazachstania exigua]
MAPTPVYVKGGVWTNIEDQILRAAIQKYGTHQWSKIASLLHKKNARQCEIRWTEFLNPQLNFMGFSKEEDIKLLTLARKLPNQWRTISDMMGRTAQLCMERYNKLLSSEDIGELNVSDVNKDLRVGTSSGFKVGDINPHADTQTAKPDNDELEDDEKEMLAEARARLLNTQGKKGTRRIRERMLEESKRIAELQKRRELKQAGVKLSAKKQKKKYADEIDYNADIPYEQAPMPGLYDTEKEDQQMLKQLKKYERNVERKGIHENISKDDTGNKKRNRKKDENVPVKEQPSMKKNKKNEDTSQSRLSKNYHSFRDNTTERLILSKPNNYQNDPNKHNVSLSTTKRELIDSRNVGNVLASKSIIRQDDDDNNINNTIPITKLTRLNSKTQKKKLHDLLSHLPSPKNDYEIVLDEEENEPGVDEDTQSSKDVTNVTNKDELIDLNIDCLKLRILPTPNFKENPQTEQDELYNELLSHNLTSTTLTRSANFSENYDDLNHQLEQLTIDVKNTINLASGNRGPLHPLLERTRRKRNGNEFLDSINVSELYRGCRDKLQKVKVCQENLQQIVGTPEEGHTDAMGQEKSEKMLQKMEELKQLHRGYYVNYKLMKNETKQDRSTRERMERALTSLRKHSSESTNPKAK